MFDVRTYLAKLRTTFRESHPHGRIIHESLSHMQAHDLQGTGFALERKGKVVNAEIRHSEFH